MYFYMYVKIMVNDKVTFSHYSNKEEYLNFFKSTIKYINGTTQLIKDKKNEDGYGYLQDISTKC